MMPGIFTCRGLRLPRSATRSTWTMTMPPELLRRHGDGQRLQRQRLALHGDVAVRVGGGAADDADIDREGLVEQHSSPPILISSTRSSVCAR